MPTPKLVAEAERLGILPKTEYVPQHYRFQREQSRTLKEMEWEESEPPIKSVWPAIIQFNAGFWVVMGPFLAIATGYWK